MSFALSSNTSTCRVVGLIPIRWSLFTQNGSWRKFCVTTRILGEITEDKFNVYLAKVCEDSSIVTPSLCQ